MMEEPLDITKTAVIRILKEDFGKRKLCACFSCCTKMGPPTKLQVFANFDPKNVTTLYRPPYCPDLSPPDYFQFPKFDNEVKRIHFVDVAAIQEAELMN
jgi:hypothetical protein